MNLQSEWYGSRLHALFSPRFDLRGAQRLTFGMNKLEVTAYGFDEDEDQRRGLQATSEASHHRRSNAGEGSQIITSKIDSLNQENAERGGGLAERNLSKLLLQDDHSGANRVLPFQPTLAYGCRQVCRCYLIAATI